MPLHSTVWNLYNNISEKNDVDSMQRLFLFRNIHTNPEYHGSQWMAEAISQSPKMKKIFFDWIETIKEDINVIQALLFIQDDENSEYYFTPEENKKIRLITEQGICFLCKN